MEIIADMRGAMIDGTPMDEAFADSIGRHDVEGALYDQIGHVCRVRITRLRGAALRRWLQAHPIAGMP